MQHPERPELCLIGSNNKNKLYARADREPYTRRGHRYRVDGPITTQRTSFADAISLMRQYGGYILSLA